MVKESSPTAIADGIAVLERDGRARVLEQRTCCATPQRGAEIAGLDPDREYDVAGFAPGEPALDSNRSIMLRLTAAR